jgi:hypothetical protein
MFPEIDDVVFEENTERLKVVLPAPRNWFLLGLFTVTLFVWVAMLVGMFVILIREDFILVLTIMLVIWLLVWLWFGRILWARWQYYAANREILFVDEEQLILRRPVSLLGITQVYDMEHVSPLYYSDKHHCPAFDYAYQHVYFGNSLEEDEARKLIESLNGRYFPNHDD